MGNGGKPGGGKGGHGGHGKPGGSSSIVEECINFVDED